MFLWFCVAAFVVTLPAVWAYLVRIRYFFQIYPLMLLVIGAQAARLRPTYDGLAMPARRAIVAIGAMSGPGSPRPARSAAAVRGGIFPFGGSMTSEVRL